MRWGGNQRLQWSRARGTVGGTLACLMRWGGNQRLQWSRARGTVGGTMLRTLPGGGAVVCSVLGPTQTWFPVGLQQPSVGLSLRCAREPVEFVPYNASYHRAAFDLLRELPSLYPGGAQWLETRLQDVLSGKAECTVAKAADRAVGILIGTPKGKRRIKLSTLYVHPHYRRQHVATKLLDLSWARWMQQGIDQVNVTVRHTRLDSLARTLTPYGFEVVRIEKNRYGEGEDEAILFSAPGGS
jgi:ribosomal protein S18 acetylase RimI-like enzyme